MTIRSAATLQSDRGSGVARRCPASARGERCLELTKISACGAPANSRCPTCPAPENRSAQGKKVSPKLILSASLYAFGAVFQELSIGLGLETRICHHGRPDLSKRAQGTVFTRRPTVAENLKRQRLGRVGNKSIAATSSNAQPPLKKNGLRRQPRRNPHLEE